MNKCEFVCCFSLLFPYGLRSPFQRSSKGSLVPAAYFLPHLSLSSITAVALSQHPTNFWGYILGVLAEVGRVLIGFQLVPCLHLWFGTWLPQAVFKFQSSVLIIAPLCLCCTRGSSHPRWKVYSVVPCWWVLGRKGAYGK